jgi:hypothetical protein
MSASQNLLDLLKGALGEPEARNELLGYVGYSGGVQFNSDGSIKSNLGDVFALPNGVPGGGPLGVAANYAVLGASAISNTGSSVLTGNLGLYPGTSVTGFPPGTFSGAENIANPAAAAAQAAAQSAYTSLGSGSFTAIPAVLDAQVLTPGNYSTGAASLAGSGAGTLTFNGAGRYVIKCASTLTTGAGGLPSMVLSNGATAANIFWLVGSSATLNSGTAGTFQGNVIAQVSITDTLGGTVNGSLAALTGAVTLSAASAVSAVSAAFAQYYLYFNPFPNSQIKSIQYFNMNGFTPRNPSVAESQQPYVTGYNKDGNGNWYVSFYIGDMLGNAVASPNQDFVVGFQASVLAVGTQT